MPSISGWASGEPVASADINAFLLRGNRNAIINGDMRVNQRGVTSATDDTYALDRWTVLSDAATITVAQSTVAPSDGKYSFALTPSTTNKKFGIIQYIENLNCTGMWGQTVTLSFKAKVSGTTNLSNIKAGLLSWSSTADSLTSDVVSAWNASGTTPTLITNWTFENTPSNLGVTTSWATYRVQGVIDTVNAANVAAFIWCDTTSATSSDTLYITDVQCEIGTIATPFERRSMADELVRCQRYYEDSVTAIMAVGSYAAALGGNTYSTSTFFKVTKRIAPTTINGANDVVGNIRIWNNAGTAGSVSLYRGGWVTTSTMTMDWYGTWGFNLTSTGSTTDAALAAFRYAYSAEL